MEVKPQMAKSQDTTKGLKVAKQQPKKEAASKVLAKKETARSLAMIDSLHGMRKCVIDECFWDSEACEGT